MSSPEQSPVEQNDQEKKDMVQVLAQKNYEESNGETETFGPPSPEDYAEAEKTLNELFDMVDDKEKRDVTEDVAAKLAVIGGFAPWAITVVVDSLASAYSDATYDRQSFVESFLERMKKNSNKIKDAWSGYNGRPATEELYRIKKEAKKLKGN